MEANDIDVPIITTNQGWSVTPLLNLVLVETVDARTEAGLHLPESAASMKRKKVIAVGPGRYVDGVFVAPQVKPGDYVIVGTHPDGRTGGIYPVPHAPSLALVEDTAIIATLSPPEPN